MISKPTGIWFKDKLVPRLYKAIQGRSFMGTRATFTVHNGTGKDGGLAMFESHFHKQLGEDSLRIAHLMVCSFIAGFLAAKERIPAI